MSTPSATTSPRSPLFTYLRDPKNPARVLTIALSTENDIVEYGLAVNAPVLHGTLPGDRFTKRRGRQIASERMTLQRSSANSGIVSGITESPRHAVIRFLADHSAENTVRRICRAALENHEEYTSTTV
jgi:HEAT repeat protein